MEAIRSAAPQLAGPLVLWAMRHWHKPGHALHLALDTTVLWNRFCVVALSVVCHGRAIPLLWQTLEHPSASVSAEVVKACCSGPTVCSRGAARSRCWRIVLFPVPSYSAGLRGARAGGT